MASSSSKSPNSNQRWKYHIFLSFRGEDTRNNFTDHLYEALKKRGFITFKDDEELNRGEIISKELLKAIEESLIYVVVLSKNYASSTWCLDELRAILESQKRLGRKVLPIFYGVEPTTVRNQTGSFKKAFEKHEKKIRDDTEKVQRWKNALKEVAGLSGLDSTNLRETELIGKIVEEVCTKIQPELPTFDDDLVGIDTKIAHMYSLLRLELDDVRFIGIWGLGGIGKTTLADVIFRYICSQFDIHCFLHNVREVSGQGVHGLIYLQRELLSHLRINGMDIQTLRQGKDRIRSLLCNRKVLLVLDDVSAKEQLENLAENVSWFGPGSRIIITTRDSHILTSHGIFAKYKIDILKQADSLQLFCQKAFKSNEPPNPHFLELLNDVIQFSRGLPLALKVMGSALCGRDISIWEDALNILKKDPDIWKILRISYDGLRVEEQQIFLDIACFFNGWSKYHLTDILEKCGFHSRYGIEVLIEKSLVTLETDGNLWMHDLLVEMGRNIVYQECPTHACKRSRLWSLEDIDNVFRKNMGTESIEAVVLNLSRPHEVDGNPEVFSKMCNLRLLIASSGLHLPHGLKCLPSGLKVLIWRGYPLKALPPGVPDELVHLEMTNSRINQLPTDIEPFSKLVSLNLNCSKDLIRTPNFAGIPNLKTLDLRGCTNLTEVDPSIGLHKNLVEVSLHECINLEKLPKTLEMSSLERLFLSGCSNVSKLPEFGENMVVLSCLHLDGTAVVELPQSLGNLTGLDVLSLERCKKFRSLNLSLPRLPPNGECVTAIDCNNLKEILLDPSISIIPGGIDFEDDVQTWHTTTTSECRNEDCQSSTNEEQFNGKDTTTSDARQPREQNLTKSMDLKCVDADNSIHLAHSISGLCPKMRYLNLIDCSLTDESILQNLGFFSSLETLDLRGNHFVNLPNDCISKLLKLKVLWLSDCRSLRSLPNLPPNVKYVYLDNCQSLESLPTLPPNVEKVAAFNCNLMKPPSDQYQQQILGVLAASMESEYNRQQKKATEKGIFKCKGVFRVPGSEIPPWFHHKHYYLWRKAFREISITVEIPDNCYKNECWGIAVCLVIEDMLPSDAKSGRLRCKSEIIGVEENYFLHCDDYYAGPIWLLEGLQLLIVHCHAQNLQFDQTKIQLTFYFDSDWSREKLTFEIKRCGYRVFSKEDAEAWRKILPSQCRIKELRSSNDDEKHLDKNDVTSCDVEADQPAAKCTKLTCSSFQIEGLQSSNDDEKQLDENDVTSYDVEVDQPDAKRTKLTCSCFQLMGITNWSSIFQNICLFLLCACKCE